MEKSYAEQNRAPKVPKGFPISENTATTVLTVDDNDALRYSLVKVLQSAGYRVIQAHNGEEALLLADGSPDLITLDINLPDVDGFEVCRRLRSNPRTAHIPIVHVSATLVDSQHKIRGLEGGADAYFTEPIMRNEFLATVRALLRLKQAEREARLHAAEAEKARQELKKAHDDLERRVQQRTAELTAKTNEIRDLTGHLLNVQDEERKHIARELHDSIGQMIALVSMNLAGIARDQEKLSSDAALRLMDSREILEKVSNEIRTISHLLHPPLLDAIGLQSAVRSYVEEFAERSGIRVDIDLAGNIGRLSREQEISLFRIVQECLTNVHRHSGSATAVVRLSMEHSQIHLEVKDSGRGMSLEKQIAINSRGSAGVGFRGMRERVRQLGGTFQVHSNAEGTIVSATLPHTIPDSMGDRG